MEAPAGRLFFSNRRRSLVDEDEIILTSVGIDIGSSTSHLMFSRIILEREDMRYIVAGREVLYASDILLTPYLDHETIDPIKLGAFLTDQYIKAGMNVSQVDTGALILTGTALQKKNSKAIADLFSEASGKFVSVAAGDELEALLAAFGSGAVARSKAIGQPILNVDIGGGTTKLAYCEGGEVIAVSAVEGGSRILAFDSTGIITRAEPVVELLAPQSPLNFQLGRPINQAEIEQIANNLALAIFHSVCSREATDEKYSALQRLPPLKIADLPCAVSFSGGVSEYIYENQASKFGDLGEPLAKAVRKLFWDAGFKFETPRAGIRATVIGASQYTVQMSGSTIFVSDEKLLPLRNVPTVKLRFSLADEELDHSAITISLEGSLQRLGWRGDGPVAVYYSWQGSATYSKMDGFCRGVLGALKRVGGKVAPVILVGDRDVGGLIGMHIAEELMAGGAIISLDGITLQDFDFIDIGQFLEGSGAVPVVVKSLIFPSQTKRAVA